MFDGPWESCMLVRGLNPSECASWVQAWGAITAIVASVAVVLLVQRAEARRGRDAKTAEEVRLLKILGQFVFEVRAKLRDIDEHPIPYLHSNWMAIEAPIACIRATPFDRYPVDSTAFAVSAALVSYDFMREAARKLGDSIGTAAQADDVDRSRQHALANFFRAEQEIEAALVTRGSKLPRIEIAFEGGTSIRTLEPEPV